MALTIFPESELYKEVLAGTYTPTGELEKLIELKTFIESLTISTRINANTVSNTAPFIADIPKDKEMIIKSLQKTIDGIDETELTAYRNSIYSL